MQRFKNILVVIHEKTENRVVVERAVTLAQRNQARLTVVNTVKEPPRQAPVLDVPEPLVELDIIEEWPPDAGRPAAPKPPVARTEWPSGAETPVTEPAVVIRERIVEEESQRLEKWVDFVRRSGVPVGGKMLYGMPFVEIIRQVVRNEHDLVMTTAEGRVGLKEILFGSAALHLMRQCPCPVWVIHSSQPNGAPASWPPWIRPPWMRSNTPSTSRSWTWRQRWPGGSRANWLSSTPGLFPLNTP